MITKKAIKILIEQALENLHEAEDKLHEASRMIESAGNRIAVAGAQASLMQTKAKVEDLIYEYESEPEAFEYITEAKRVVFRESFNL